MADIHVLTGDGKRTWTVVFHIEIPDQPNAVSVSYRTALVNSEIGGTTALPEGSGPGQITVAEKALVEAGELFEMRFSFRAEGDGDSAAAIQRMLRRKFTRESAILLAKLQVQLKYFGHTEQET